MDPPDDDRLEIFRYNGITMVRCATCFRELAFGENDTRTVGLALVNVSVRPCCAVWRE